MDPHGTAGRATQAILIVEEDEATRRILDLSLRHAGFAVGLAANTEEAIQRLADGPDLVIAGVSDSEALALCRQIKQTTERLPPAVVLISDPGVESKTRGLEAGADDFIVRPIYIQEVVARTRALLQRRERERLEISARAKPGAPDGNDSGSPVAERFVSDIGDVPLVDLLRAIAAHGKSGVASIIADGGARGEIFFRQGNVVDAEVGRLSGRDAVYRLFCWSAGHLEIDWKSIRRKDLVEMRTPDLLMEALRRVDEWRRLLVGLPPLDTIFEVDYRVLAEQLADIPDEVNRILRLFDGVRTFLQVIDDCGLPDLDAAAAIGRLCHQRIIHDIRLPPADDDVVGTDMEAWLVEATGPFRSSPRAERELFGSPPEGGVGVHGRPTAPVEPLGEGTGEPLDEDLRARFTDRLQADDRPSAPLAEASSDGGSSFAEPAAAAPAPASATTASFPTAPGFPSVLHGAGAPDVEGRAATSMPVVRGELETSIEAAARSEDITVRAVPPLDEAGAPSPIVADASGELAVAAEDAIVSAEDATPIIDTASAAAAANIVSEHEVPTAVQAALPTIPETRSASGEIVVRPTKTRIKHSPAAEVRLAHIREENARSYVRASQTLTPPGSARALDEPPPLLDSAPPEPPPRVSTQLVRPTAVEDAVDGDAEEDRPRSRRRGPLIVAAVAMVVIAGGAVVLGLRHSGGEDNAADEGPARSPLAAAPPTALPAPPPAPASPAQPAAAPPHTAPAAAPARDELEEWNADPKLARARTTEAPGLLFACRTSYQEARMKDAEAICAAARDANPNSAEANGFLAHALFNRNRRRESLAAAERAVKLNPKWADAYVVIGGIHQDAGEMADAKQAYQRYLELDPHGPFAADLRAIVDRLGKL